MQPGKPLAVAMIDANRNGILLSAAMPEIRLVEREQERRWRLVMAYLLAGLRLRQALGDDDGEAVLEPDGRVVHAEADARSTDARDALRRAALAVDRARSSAGDREPDAALLAWQGLVEGRWSLVDRFDNVLDSGRKIASGLAAETIHEAARSAALRLLRGERCYVIPLDPLDQTGDLTGVPASHVSSCQRAIDRALRQPRRSARRP